MKLLFAIAVLTAAMDVHSKADLLEHDDLREEAEVEEVADRAAQVAKLEALIQEQVARIAATHAEIEDLRAELAEADESQTGDGTGAGAGSPESRPCTYAPKEGKRGTIDVGKKGTIEEKIEGTDKVKRTMVASKAIGEREGWCMEPNKGNKVIGLFPSGKTVCECIQECSAESRALKANGFQKKYPNAILSKDGDTVHMPCVCVAAVRGTIRTTWTSAVVTSGSHEVPFTHLPVLRRRATRCLAGRIAYRDRPGPRAPSVSVPAASASAPPKIAGSSTGRPWP